MELFLGTFYKDKDVAVNVFALCAFKNVNSCLHLLTSEMVTLLWCKKHLCTVVSRLRKYREQVP